MIYDANDPTLKKEIYYHKNFREKLIIYFDKDGHIVRMDKEHSWLYIGLLAIIVTAISSFASLIISSYLNYYFTYFR
jgi:hypothetical protein